MSQHHLEQRVTLKRNSALNNNYYLLFIRYGVIVV